MEKPVTKAGERGVCLSLYSRLGLTAENIKELYPILSAPAKV